MYMMRSLRKESGSPNLIDHRPNSLKRLGLLLVDRNAHVRASTLVDVKFCIIQKVHRFAHFDQKNTHIIGGKIMHKCTIVTVTVHICMVTVALAFNILIIFYLSLSLSFGHSPFPFPHFFLASLSLSEFCLWVSPFWSLSLSSFDQTTPCRSSNEALSPSLSLSLFLSQDRL